MVYNQAMPEYWCAARGLSVAMFAFALYLLLLWARKRDRRRDLALALLFLVMGLYDLFVANVYAVSRPEDAIPWLRLLSAADNIAAPIFLWYLAEYTGLVRRRALAAWASLFCLIALAEIVAPGDIAWDSSRPVAFVVDLPFLPEIQFRQVAAGPLSLVSSLAGLAFLGHCIFLIRRYAGSGHRREAGGFAWIIVAVFLAIINDTLVGMGAYRFVFLTEYAWAGALVFLTYRSSDEILAGAEAIRRLDRSEARLRAMVEHAPFNIWMCDAEGRIIMQNAADVAAVGDHAGQLYSEWVPPEGGHSPLADMSRRALSGEVVDQNVTYEYGGRRRIYRDIIAPARSENAIIGSVGVGIDITEQVRVEQELLARLSEKEVLLREIHHRVKNNLQVVASLLSIQGGSLEDARAKEVFLAVQRQVRAISRVHESLYMSDNLATIDFGEYLRTLARELVGMRESGGIETLIEAESIFLDIDRAIPCALIANELITNSMKHAFRGRESGRLGVSLRRLEPGFAELAVEDDGEGIPAEATANAGSSIGRILVATLADQLRGTIEIRGARRNRVELRFPA
jgi:PAS domain S-box-containing protein